MLGNSRKRRLVFTQSTLDSQLSSESDITSRFISSSFQPSPPPSYNLPSTLNTNQYSESEEIAARSLSRPTIESQCCGGWCNQAKKPIKRTKQNPPIHSVADLLAKGLLELCIVPVCNMDNISSTSHQHTRVSVCNTHTHTIPFKF